jgi:Transposase DDE domain group 1
MNEDMPLAFDLPAVARKKVSAAFDGGRITSDGGVMLLAQAERRLGIADQLARVIPDERDADRVVHLLPDILRARIFAIACGYEDADDLDRLRFDPALKLACGRLPDTGRDLCSQPTVSRWENAPNLRDLIRLMGVMVDLCCASYKTPPAAVTLDIDDTVDVVHGHQQLFLFNAHYDERRFPRPPHSPALAHHWHHHPGRWPLRPPGGHGLVRREWSGLHLRAARQRRARPRGR